MWGDEDEDYLPPTTESEPDKEGIITVTSFKFNERKEKIKVITRVKRYTRRKRISKKALERRRNWVKFGAATDVEENLKITFPSYDAILMEDPTVEVTKEDELVKKFDGRQSVVVCRKCGKDHWTLNCPYKDLAMGDIPAGETEAKPAVAAGGAGGKSGYVPPHLRKGYTAPEGSSAGAAEELSTSIRVSNVSTNANEDDLRELFLPFGGVSRVFLAKDRETFQSRGFAYVSFHDRGSAEKAMEALQGYGYDHLILSLSWAKPSNRDPGKEGGLSSGYVSGYGKALPQGMGPKKE